MINEGCENVPESTSNSSLTDESYGSDYSISSSAKKDKKVEDPCTCCGESLLDGQPTYYCPSELCKCRSCTSCWCDWIKVSIEQLKTQIQCMCGSRNLSQLELENLLD